MALKFKFPRLEKFGFFTKFLIIVGLLAVILGLFVIMYFSVLAHRFDLSKIGNMPERSEVYDYKGRMIARLHGENRTTIPLEYVSKDFVSALLAREDSRFFKHHGVDFRGVARALYQNIKRGGVSQGASTITMQLARNSFGMFEKTMHRKAVEIFLALRIERKFSKKEILTHYVNRIYFGGKNYGIEKAANSYFGKRARQLTLGESAMLAGIIRSPNRLSPHRHPKRAHEERNVVLNRMVKLNFIDAKRAESAQKITEKIVKKSTSRKSNSYDLDAIERQLNSILSKGDIEFGGLKIFSTIDKDLQKASLDALNEHIASFEKSKNYPHQRKSEFRKTEKNQPKYMQGAIVIIDNKTGGIRALVGGRDFKESMFNRAIQAHRQIGSIFKPFVYATAFSNGLLPGTYINDNQIQSSELYTIDVQWNPANSDRKYYGLMPAEWGLIKSRNTMSVRVGQYAGLESVATLAKALGFKSNLEPSPVSYLGISEETPLDVCSAYSIFPNQCIKIKPYIIYKIIAKDGTVLFTQNLEYKQVLSEKAVLLTHRALSKVTTEGTAASTKRLGFKKPAGGKTGTTDNFKDAWFAGYTSALTGCVWVGMDSSKQTLYRGYGSKLALPIWVKIMLHAEKNGYNFEEILPDGNLVQTNLCHLSGQLPNRICQQRKFAYVDKLPPSAVPQEICKIHSINIRRTPPPPVRRTAPRRSSIFDKIKNFFNRGR